VIFGVLLNRFNTFVIAYNPPYTETSYFPSISYPGLKKKREIQVSISATS